jgi:hypothetical protein
MATANQRRKKMLYLTLIIAALALIAINALKKPPPQAPLYNTNHNTPLQTQTARELKTNTREPAANTALNEARILSSESTQNNPTQTNTSVGDPHNTPDQNYNVIAAPVADAAPTPNDRAGGNNTGE